MDGEDYYSEESPDPTPLIADVLTDYADQVINAFREGRLADAMPVYLGVYEGTQTATEPADDEYGIIDDYPAQTWEVWYALLTDAHRQLSERVLHPDQISHALNQLAERVNFFDKVEAADEIEDDDFYDEQAPQQVWYHLKSFEPLLLALVTDEPSARVVQQAINEHNWQNRGTEYVQLRIADVLSDPNLWLQTADAFADHDAVLGLQLLRRLQQTGDRAALLTTLHRLTQKFPRTFDPFILDNLDPTTLLPGNDLNLYLNALDNRCREHGQLPDYLRLREYYSESQRRQFADSLVDKAGVVRNPVFYAQVLQTENRLPDVLTFVKRLEWLNIRGLPSILQLLAPTYPHESMDMTMERSTDYLDNGQRGRATYQAISDWLAMLNQFQSLKPQVAIFAEHLYKTYSRLSTLREELRTAKLVRGK